MKAALQQLSDRARDVLEGNWTGRHTRPAPRQYPHQWNWDSGFIAIGYSCYKIDRAAAELASLYGGQWKNGMLPQIIYDPDTAEGYFPGPAIWETGRCPHAPDSVLTSGITMPPIHAVAFRLIYERGGGDERGPGRQFAETYFSNAFRSLEYLYREREISGTGLIWIRHPWESGLDNSPAWDSVLAGFEYDPARLPSYERKDLDHGIPHEQRPSDSDYQRYVYLIDLFRRHGYDEQAIQALSPFLIAGPLFNSILCRACIDLAWVADRIGRSREQAILAGWAERTSAGVRERLWHGTHGETGQHAIFDTLDVANGRRIEIDTAAGFMPLFAGIPTAEQAADLYDYLESSAFCAMKDGRCYSIPNYSTEKEGFDRRSYWRGPVWLNVNWMLADGLDRHGYHEKAGAVRLDMLRLALKFGFHEYFDPFEGRGYGTDRFSWSAALILDTIARIDDKKLREITG